MQTIETQTFSVVEVSQVLGIGRARIYRALKAGTIPSLRSGKKFRVPRRAVEELLEDPESFNREKEGEA